MPNVLPIGFGVPAAAQELGCRPGLIYKLAARGDLAHYRIGGRLRFTSENLAEFLEASKRPRRARIAKTASTKVVAA